VRGVGGFPIGSLCLLDVRPRKMTDHERRVLESFADDLSEEIQQRATGKGTAALAARQSALVATG
jgi:GAF domain-containing protein